MLFQIKETNNKFIEDLRQCEESRFPTYIYGNGEGARNVERRAATIGFKFSGRVVDKSYYKIGQDCLCLDDVVKGKINLVVAHRGFDKNKLNIYKKNIAILVDRDCFSGNYEVDPEMMTYEYVLQHQDKLEKIFKVVSDDKSKASLLAYINQKISMDYKYLRTVKSECQYFDSEIVKLTNDEVFVDVGAYVGDTVQAFLGILKKQGITNYKAIYSFEPDCENYKQLQLLNIKNFHTFNIATSDKEGEEMFSSIGKGSSSGISKKKCEEIVKNQIKTGRLDDILSGKPVTFIKMDVEGYELESLKGAEQIIKTQKPKLAICIYHKKSDLWEIYEYIHSLSQEYHFWIRAYEETATELVLYAIA